MPKTLKEYSTPLTPTIKQKSCQLNYFSKQHFIPKFTLHYLYYKQKLSAKRISKILQCSVYKVKYWMKQYHYPTRPLNLAIYYHHNQNGDPFKIKTNLTQHEKMLKHIALGLYWGEGAKSAHHNITLGNTDSGMIKIFHEYLTSICRVKKEKIKYYLQTFNDTSITKAKQYWSNKLNIDPKTIKHSEIPSLGSGTYKRLNKFGVLSIAVFNTRLKTYIMHELDKIGYCPQPKMKNKVKLKSC